MGIEQFDQTKRNEAFGHRIPKEVVDAIEEQPRLVRALSLFCKPIETDLIEACGFPFSTWTNSQLATFMTDTGPYLKSIARLYVRTHATPEELEIARQDCIRILDKSVAVWGDRPGTYHRYHRAENCASVGYRSQLIVDVTELCKIYKREDRPYELVLLLSKTNLDALELPIEAQQIAFWAYEQTNWHPAKR